VIPKDVERSEDALQLGKLWTRRGLASIHGAGDLIDVSTYCTELRYGTFQCGQFHNWKRCQRAQVGS
jgi:hypothetical protein